MALTKAQFDILRRYRNYRDRPPTVAGLLRHSWKVHAFLCLTVGLGAWACQAMRAYVGAYVVIGLGIGAIARDIGIFRRSVQHWPILVQILDWQQIDALLEQESDGNVR